MAEKIKIGGELDPRTPEKILGDASTIKDRAWETNHGDVVQTPNQKQDEINEYFQDQIDNIVATEQGGIQTDAAPTEGSVKLVQSGGTYTTIQNAATTAKTFLTGETVPAIGIDTNPTNNSTNLVKSGGVKTAIDDVAFSTNEKVKNVGIDAEPTAGSDNLVKSGGVQNELNNLSSEIKVLRKEAIFTIGAFVNTSGVLTNNGNYKYSNPIYLNRGDILITNSTGGSGTTLISKTNNEGSFYAPYILGNSSVTNNKILITDAGYYCISLYKTGTAEITVTNAVDVESDYLKNNTYNSIFIKKENIAGGIVSQNINTDKSICKIIVSLSSTSKVVDILLTEDNTELLTAYNQSGGNITIDIPIQYRNVINKITIIPHDSTSSTYTLTAEYIADNIPAGAVSDSHILNSIIKELYISSSNIFGKFNYIKFVYGVLNNDSGKYEIGFIIMNPNGSISSRYVASYNTISEIENLDYGKIITTAASLVKFIMNPTTIQIGYSSDIISIRLNDTVKSLRYWPIIAQESEIKPMLNVSTKYPTGGLNGGVYYDLAAASAKVDSEYGAVGLILQFRESSYILKTYILEGVSGGGYDVFYHNPNNYTELFVEKDDGIENYCLDVSKTYPNGGSYSDGRFTLRQAQLQTPSALQKQIYRLKFKDFSNIYQEWIWTGNPTNNFSTEKGWMRVDIPLAFEASCENRLANPYYETREHWNTQHQSNQMEEVIVHPLTSDGVTRRIPVCIITNNNTYLSACLYQQFSEGSVGADFGYFGIEVARKPEGGTWTSSIVLPYSSELGQCCQPCFVIDRQGVMEENGQTHIGRIYLFYVRNTDVDGEGHPMVWFNWTTRGSSFNYIYSDDDGVTWSEPVVIADANNGVWDTTSYLFMFNAPNNGIQLTNGTFVVPCMGIDITSSSITRQSRSTILYRTISGSWTFASKIPWLYAMDECAVVETENNHVVLGARNNKADYIQGDYDRFGTWMYEYDFSNDTWTEKFSTFMQNRSCQYSLERIIFNEGGTNEKRVYLMSAIDQYKAGSRENITIWISLDLKQWLRVYRVHKANGNGYSSVSYFNNKLVISYEGSSIVYFQDITPIISLIEDSVAMIEGNISVQDRIQILFNKLAGIE